MKTKNTPPTPVATGDNTTTEAGRPWPGNTEWTDDDYKQFVQLYSQGAFPGIHHDPTAWDHHFIPADNGANSQRPTLISHHDFHHHLPARQQVEAQKQQLRHEIQNLQGNLPIPEPKTLADPRHVWYEKIMAAALPGAKLIEKVKHVRQAVIDGS